MIRRRRGRSGDRSISARFFGDRSGDRSDTSSRGVEAQDGRGVSREERPAGRRAFWSRFKHYLLSEGPETECH